MPEFPSYRWICWFAWTGPARRGSFFSAWASYSPQSTRLEPLTMFSSFVPVQTKAKVPIALHPARHPAPARPHRRQRLVIDQRQAAQIRVCERQDRRLLHAHRATPLLFCHLTRTDAAAAFSVNLVVIYHHDKNDTCLRCRASPYCWPLA